MRALQRKGLPGLSLKQYVSAAWDGGGPEVVGGDALAWNWHLDALCDHLQALVAWNNDGPQNLLINVPPGTMKSLVMSAFLPSWVWLWRPSWRAIFASGSPSVVTRDSLKCRTLIRSDWYQQTFEPRWKISTEQDEKQLFANTEGGSRQGIGAGAAVTGQRADFLGVDDPNDAREVHSKAHRENINERWWSSAFHNRIADPERSRRCIIMQRLHAEDLAGYVLSREKGQWAHLKIPMEFTGERKKTWIGWTDPRTKEGELLFPERFGAEYIGKEKNALGSSGYAGQMQQEPTAEGGNKFLRGWWRFWSSIGQGAKRPLGCSEAPPRLLDPRARDLRFDEIVISLDAAFKDLASSDWVVGGVIGRIGPSKFVLARERKHVDIIGTIDMVLRFKKDWPRVGRILIEDKANGSAAIQVLRKKIPGVVAIEPRGGKESRAAAILPTVEAGDVFLPEGAEWLGEWCDEFADFPLGKHDDQVDMLSQACNEMDSPNDVERARALLGLK